MKTITFIALGLFFLISACDSGIFYVDIGDYEYQWEAWNSQNMLDYQLIVRYRYPNMAHIAKIIVKNGTPEGNDSTSKGWIKNGLPSTIPEFYSRIKNYEKNMKDAHNNGDKRSMSLEVSYNTEYHHPNSIVSKDNGYITVWKISLVSLEEEVLTPEETE